MPDIFRRTNAAREAAIEGPAPAASAPQVAPGGMSQADFFKGGPRTMTPEQAAKLAAMIRAQMQQPPQQ